MKQVLAIIGLVLILSPLKAQDSDPFRSAIHSLASINITVLMPLKQDAPPVEEDYATLEAHTFARMNWGIDEISWFRRTYGTPDHPSMFGIQEDYIREVAAAYDQLDSADDP